MASRKEVEEQEEQKPLSRTTGPSLNFAASATSYSRASYDVKQASTSDEAVFAGRKRDRNADDASFDEPTPEEFSKMTRPERKRHREKKRRNDVNRGFDELLTLLIDIDPQVRNEVEEKSRRGQGKAYGSGSHDENILSRVDLISRTIDVLSRLKRENVEKDRVIKSIMEGRSAGDQGIASTLQNTNDAALPKHDAGVMKQEEPSLSSVQMQLNQNLAGIRMQSAVPGLGGGTSSFTHSPFAGGPSSLPSLSIAQRLSALSHLQTPVDPNLLLQQHVAQPASFLDSTARISGRSNTIDNTSISSDMLLQSILRDMPAGTTQSDLLQLVQQQDSARRLLLENQLRGAGSGSSAYFPDTFQRQSYPPR